LSSSLTCAAEAATGGTTLIVISSPDVLDAHGDAVPASLSVHEDTVTLTVKPAEGTTFPVLAALTVAAPSDNESAERDPFEYGLADNHALTFNGKNPQISENVSRLKGSTAPLHIQTARLAIPWDILSAPSLSVKLKEAEEWVLAVEGDKLEPYITIEARKGEAHAPGVKKYRNAVEDLMKEFPAVKRWGAWNEPDDPPNLVTYEMAAHYWQAAEWAAVKLKCKCTIVAGEFYEYADYADDKYAENYRRMLLKYDPEAWSHDPRAWARHRVPSTWGFHDYEDVVEVRNKNASEFQHFATGRGLGKPRIWISEAGVELHDSVKSTRLVVTHNEKLEFKRQIEAANAFLTLREAKPPHEKTPSRIERVYYYSYEAPGQEMVKENANAFDSGLVEAQPSGEARPAYCYLAYKSHDCPPTVETVQLPNPDGPLEAIVDTHGIPTTVEMLLSGEGCGGGEFCDQPFKEKQTQPEVGGDVIHPLTVSFPKPGCPGTFKYYAAAHNEVGSSTGAVFPGAIGCI
jgi:hypothetical protein